MTKSFSSQDLKRGMFLVASPENKHPLFQKTVILICEHSPAGSFGLMINKPIQIDPAMAELPEEIPSEGLEMRIGGPMQPSQMMLLHTSNLIPDQTLKVLDGVFLGGDVDFLNQSTQSANAPSILLCIGYSGWLAGQLEHELSAGDWLITDASKKSIFESDPNSLWADLLKGSGGHYNSISSMPDNLELN